MIFQEGAADLMETVIDPMLLFFYIIATIIFAISSYKKPNLRMFIFVCSLMTGAIVWCIVGVELIEGIFVLMASVFCVIGAGILRMRITKSEVEDIG